MRKLRTLLPGAILIVAVLLAFTNPGEANSQVLSEARMGPYLCRTYFDESNFEGIIEVQRNGERVLFERVQGRPMFAKAWIWPNCPERFQSVTPEDITGDGVPDLIVDLGTNGNHSGFAYYVLSLGERFRKVATFEPGPPIQFGDLDWDGSYEVAFGDDTFAYWKADGANSPHPRFVMRFRESGYRMAEDLMRSPAPDQSLFDAAVRRTRLLLEQTVSNGQEDPPPQLWGYMLYLIYSGNGDLAWRFFDRVWTDQKMGKQKFLAEFKAQLSTSPHWTDLKKLNGWK